MSFDSSEAAKLVGAESGVLRAVDKVSKSDIRHWCEVIGDPDPAYDEKIRKETKAAPPAMIMVWALDPLWPPKEAREPHETLLKLLDDAGYSAAAGLGLEQEFLRPVRIGDRLSFKVKIAGLSKGEQATKIGKGIVVDLHYTFLDGGGQVVSTQKVKVLKFRSMTLAS